MRFLEKVVERKTEPSAAKGLSNLRGAILPFRYLTDQARGDQNAIVIARPADPDRKFLPTGSGPAQADECSGFALGQVLGGRKRRLRRGLLQSFREFDG